MWRCPLCKHPLTIHDKTWQCDNGHAFDKAKAGYVNLLPVQFKKSLQPGDDKIMLRARRGFHQRQSYQPLMTALTDLVSQAHPETQIRLYDAGCGEGAYLRNIAESLALQGKSTTAAGSDIAKLAVEMAAKQAKTHQYVVASSHQLPLEDESVDTIMQIFAPGDAGEYARVLSSRGTLLTVSPGPEHLYELKQHIYDSPERHVLPDAALSHFSLQESRQITFTLNFENPEHVSELIAMTPFSWKLDEGRKATLGKTLEYVTADFICQVWRKQAPEEDHCEK
ncbi:putative RNA methyltransferase [Alteromonas antoniana]|uniref:putative RNA methyltransferase n=1 Tax=Alteromonas antoniana TaxID=2803813 RepID=UPI001C45504B|nr:methyltransferase domain-containing protein [Alteromonas antoniana]